MEFHIVKRIVIGDGKYKCAVVDVPGGMQLIIRRNGRAEAGRIGWRMNRTINEARRGDVVFEFRERKVAQMFGVLVMNLIGRMADDEFGLTKHNKKGG